MRKTKDFTVETPGRDEGKTYRITEMPAVDAEKWGWRALGAMARSGIEVPPYLSELGMAGILVMGFRSLFAMQFADAEPLLDELMSCVTRIESAVPNGRPLVTSDIEEPKTVATLRSEVFELHTGFSVADYLSKIWVSATEKVEGSLSQ